MKSLLAALLLLSVAAAVTPASAGFGANEIQPFDGPSFGPKDLSEPPGPARSPWDQWGTQSDAERR